MKRVRLPPELRRERKPANRITFTDLSLRRLKPKDSQFMVWDHGTPGERGLGLLVSPGGTKAFRSYYYFPGSSKPHSRKLGRFPQMIIPEARELAREDRRKAAKGIDPKRDAETALADNQDSLIENVIETFIERHAKQNKTWQETRRIFETYVLPEWKSRPITGIRRSDVVALLDKIEDKKIEAASGRMLGGAVSADRTLAAVRKLMNWWAIRDNDFVSPIVTGMARTKPKDRVRTRILSDDEIRVLWEATGLFKQGEVLGVYFAAVRILLLTAQRRSKVNFMRRSLIDGNGVWDPTDDADGANKRTGLVPLPQSARELINSQPIVNSEAEAHQDFVFTLNGRTPFNGWSKCKHELDIRMLRILQRNAVKAGQDPGAVELRHWVHHDLRRTAKTLMVRARVRPDISERVLGHVISGVEGVYDLHDYIVEKREALEALSMLIKDIIKSPADKT